MSSSKILLLLAILACQPAAPPRESEAARRIGREFASPHIARWQLRVAPAGRDCTALLVRAGVVLDDYMIEKLHYGSALNNVPVGGMQQRARQEGFRGVIYVDSSGRRWAYGAITSAELVEARECR